MSDKEGCSTNHGRSSSERISKYRHILETIKFLSGQVRTTQKILYDNDLSGFMHGTRQHALDFDPFAIGHRRGCSNPKQLQF